MNKINNKCVLTGDKFIPELHLKQKGFTYSTCRPFTKNREKIQKFREISSLKYLYRKYYFAHDAAYSNSKDLAKKNLSNTIKLILLSLKWMIESELQSIRLFLVKVTLNIGQEKCLL